MNAATDEILVVNEYRPRHDLLRDRVILVTGAGSGIGAAAAQALAAHGATAILLGRDPSNLKTVYDGIEAQGNPQPAIYPMDLAGAAPQDYDDLAHTLLREFGTLHAVLHNAAFLPPLGPFATIGVADWYQALQVNLNAPFLLTQACMGLLGEAADAAVVFTLDDPGRIQRAYWGAYGVSKLAIAGMLAILADELENTSSIRVNAVIPCPVRTSLRARAFAGEDPSTLPRPAAIMSTYLYLCGPDSIGTTGKTFRATVPTTANASAT